MSLGFKRLMCVTETCTGRWRTGAYITVYSGDAGTWLAGLEVLAVVWLRTSSGMLLRDTGRPLRYVKKRRESTTIYRGVISQKSGVCLHELIQKRKKGSLCRHITFCGACRMKGKVYKNSRHARWWSWRPINKMKLLTDIHTLQNVSENVAGMSCACI
jgi:hypothetical protein